MNIRFSVSRKDDSGLGAGSGAENKLRSKANPLWILAAIAMLVFGA